MALLTLILNPLIGWLAIIEARECDAAFRRGELVTAAAFRARVKTKFFFSFCIAFFVAAIVIGITASRGAKEKDRTMGRNCMKSTRSIQRHKLLSHELGSE